MLKDAQIAVESTRFKPQSLPVSDSVKEREKGSSTFGRWSWSDNNNLPFSGRRAPPFTFEPQTPRDTNRNNLVDAQPNFAAAVVQPNNLDFFKTTEDESPHENTTNTSMSSLPAKFPRPTRRKLSSSSGGGIAPVYTDSVTPTNLRASSSSESFRSAISEQDSENSDIIGSQIRALQSLLHAFQTALDTLESLIARRLSGSATKRYPAAYDLRSSLQKGKTEIERKHEENCESYGHDYLQCFTVSGMSSTSSTLCKLLKP